MSSLRNTYNKITQGINGLVNLWFGVRLAMGFITGSRPEVKFGYSPDVAGVHDVWAAADAQALFIEPAAVGVNMEILSTDNVTDIGIEIEYVYIKPDGTEDVGQVILNGTTPVQLPSGLIRFIQRAYNSNGARFVGKLTIRLLGGGNIYASMFADDQQTTQTMYFVPLGEVAFINNYSTALNKSGGSDASSIMRLVVQKDGKVARTQIRYGLQRNGVSNLSSDLIIPIPVPPLSIVRVIADTSASAEISGEYSMVMVNENMIPQSIRNQY